MGRVHPIATDCFLAARLQRLLCGGDLRKLSVVCRARSDISRPDLVAPEAAGRTCTQAAFGARAPCVVLPKHAGKSH
jgi:hypothetical protein